MGLQVLALCGSLRAASVNAAVLRAAAALAPAGLQVTLYPGLGALPLFDMDLDAALPPPVRALREAVARADALLIASPEYAHGVSSVMKTALDWLVSLEHFVGKPVALLNAQPRAHWSDGSLREILATMSARLVEPASVGLHLSADTLTTEGMLASPAVSASIRSALLALHEAVAGGAPAAPSFPMR
ncbi:MAG: NAD(P)H-dependent oxidoreductase [Rhizobacter sp.]|nr:NAD(P)H-dependent oxidoreductase [Rhizobacter sp.]